MRAGPDGMHLSCVAAEGETAQGGHESTGAGADAPRSAAVEEDCHAGAADFGAEWEGSGEWTGGGGRAGMGLVIRSTCGALAYRYRSLM